MHILLYCLLLWATFGVGHNSCRQCSGLSTIVFEQQQDEDFARNFFNTNFELCATGKDYQYEITAVSGCDKECNVYTTDNNKTYCLTYFPRTCLKWTFSVKVWRYCGNGGAVNLRKGRHCSQGGCAVSDDLNLTCNRSVQCRGDCKCNLCGC